MRNGPELLAQVLARACVRERAQVVDQRVDPDVDHLLGVPRNRHAPGLARAAEAEISEAARDEAAGLVVAEVWEHEVGPLVVEAKQLLLECREPEEPVALLDPFGLGPVLEAQPVGGELIFGLELLTADAVQAGVDVLVDVPVVVDLLDELLDEAMMALIGRAYEEVRRRAHSS